MNIFIKRLINNMCMLFFFLYMISYNIFSYKSNTVIISEIILICFLALVGVYILINKSIHIGIFSILLLLYLIWSSITNFWAINQQVALVRLITIFQLSIVSFFIYNYFDSKEKISKAIYYITLSYTILAIYTIYKYGLGNILSGDISQRIGSDISQENVLGMALALGAILCFYRSFYLSKKIYYLPSMLLFILSSFTGSRKALIIVVLGSVFLVTLKNGTKKMFKTTVGIIIIMIILFLILNIPAFDMVLQRFSGLIGGEKMDASSVERINMIKDGWMFFLKKPIIGYGLDCFRDLGYGTYSHNNYIEILINGGVISFILFYNIYLYCILKLIKQMRKRDKIATILIILIFMQLIRDFAEVSYYSKILYINFAIYFAYIDVMKNKDIQ